MSPAAYLGEFEQLILLALVRLGDDALEDGGLAGYRWGLERKQALIAQELELAAS